MPLTEKGREIKKAMQKEYGEEKGEEVFYASANKGTITGVHDMQSTPAEPKEMTAPEPSGPEKEMKVPEPQGKIIPVTRDSLADINKRNRDKYGR